MRKSSIAVLVTLTFLGSSLIAEAQVGQASVVGRVLDPTGAFVPGVEVEMRQVATNQFFRTVTTDTGDYTLTNLPVGAYEIQVSAAGFKTELRSGVTMEVGRTYRMDFTLSLGAVTETIEVTAEAPLLQTEAPTMTTIIENKKIVGLPLNGRDVIGSLVLLSPGIAPARGNRLGNNFSANFHVRGMRPQDTMVLVDGSMLSQNNGQMTYTQGPDSVQEFAIKTGLYGAEYGIRPGGVISLVTKSGTNLIHGTVFNFLRNDNLDARNFFDPGERPEFKQNQYGATVGGPIFIPGVFDGRDNAWFFVSWQAQRQKRLRSFTGIVPTADQKNGIFTSPITDPLTGTPFPNNTIPADRLNSTSQQFLQFWPSPNFGTGSGINFRCGDCTSGTDKDQLIAKIDFRTGDNDRWSMRGIWDSAPIDQINTIQAFSRVDSLRTWAVNLVNTHTFSPTVINEFGVHYFKRPYSPGLGEATKTPQGFNQALGLPRFPRSTADNDGVLDVSIPGFLRLGDPFWHGAAPIGHYPEIKEALSFFKGAHTVKLGYALRRNFSWNSFSRGSSVNFSDRYTGNAFGDFLLGHVTSSEFGADSFFGDLSQVTHAWYIQDDWKVTNKLTINLGLRYEYRGPWVDHSGLSANINDQTGELFPAFQFDPNLPATEEGRYEADVPLVEMTNDMPLPRLGFAYRITDRTVFRGGYGAYSNEPYFAGYWFLGGAPRQNAALESNFGGAVVPDLSMSNPFPDPGFDSPEDFANAGFNPWGIQSPLPRVVVHSWGASIQRELTPDMSFEIGYQGSRSLNEFSTTTINDAAPGRGLEELRPRRPFPDFTTILMFRGDGDATYHGLEATIRKRPGPDGLSLLAAFTFSKSIDLSSSGGEGRAPNTGDLNRGMGAGSVNGRFTFVPGYTSPFGPGKRFLNDGFAGRVLGDWTFYGILTLMNGPYLTVGMPSDSLNVGSTSSFRPDLVGNPNTGRGSFDPNDPNQTWFNTSAFVAPPLLEGSDTLHARFGNAGRGIVQGVGVTNLDLAVLRDFTLHERLMLQFRFEAFNITNTANFRDPGTTFGTGGFGRIGSAFDARDLQFGLKLLW